MDSQNEDPEKKEKIFCLKPGWQDDDLDIEEIMDTWMRQMNYPLITVEYDSGDAIAVIEQSR